MQNKVDIYISQLPDNQRLLAEKVNTLLLGLVPEIQEKISFKIPFYYYFGMFCYINPVANGIDIGFCRGCDLLHEFPQLELKNRATVASVTLYTLHDIKRTELAEIIVAAAIWNKEASKNNIPLVRKKNKK